MVPRRTPRLRLSHVVLALYWGLLFAATHLSIPDTVPFSTNRWDKIYHLVAFGGLALLVAWALQASAKHPLRYLWVMVVVSVYAIADEWSQSLLMSRTADFWDAIADVCGAAVGVTLFGLMQASLRRTLTDVPILTHIAGQDHGGQPR